MPTTLDTPRRLTDFDDDCRWKPFEETEANGAHDADELDHEESRDALRSDLAFFLTALFTVALVLGLHASCYLRLVQSDRLTARNASEIATPSTAPGASLERSERKWTGLFAPIHWLDRQIRPEFWSR